MPDGPSPRRSEGDRTDGKDAFKNFMMRYMLHVYDSAGMDHWWIMIHVTKLLSCTLHWQVDRCCWILLFNWKELGLCSHSTRLFLKFNELVVHQTWSWGCPVARIVEGTNTQSMLNREIVWGLAIIYIPVSYLPVYVPLELFTKRC